MISSVAGQHEPIPGVRPPMTSFVLGIVLIAIIGAAISSLFLFTHSVGLLASAFIAIVIGLAGLFSLVWGNIQRVRLIRDLGASAAKKEACLKNNSGDRAEILKELRDYEEALRDVRADKQASQITQFVWDEVSKPPSHARNDDSDEPGADDGYGWLSCLPVTSRIRIFVSACSLSSRHRTWFR